MKKSIKTIIVCFLFAVFFAFQINASIKLPSFFSDNMVLQQQSEVAIWGWSNPNTSVKVVTSWDKKNVTTKSDKNGYWKLKLKTPVASKTPYEITVTSGTTITLKNVLIGEVWICSGQSNMEMPMKGFHGQPIEGGPEAIMNSRNPEIRCFTAQKASKSTPQDDCIGSWKVADIQTVPDFSATAYFFGRMINQALDVPVGLIHTSWGGSRIEAWMPPEALKDIPEKKIPVTDEDIKINNGTATVLYNGMLHPFIGYGIRGAIWYQGESNKDEPALYVKMFDNMVREWRNLWGIGEFPFYYCQIAPYNYGGLSSAYIREAQFKCMETPNTGMAVLMDSESPGCIHPPKKKEAGERLALWALAKTYGMEKIHYRSPEVQSFDIEGRVIILTFNNANLGLTSHGKEILNFSVAGKNKHFHPAKAAISGNKIFIFSPNVAEPVAVRYCFDNLSATEIFTIEGNLPISSFRTDEW
ncbi:MAG: sialate O-acetylesterase [Bacteroidales bacterium]|jgi:sialate O-acetylesterase|nr:sialate O-acetylesterase [Bacteroidales bacterium]